MNLSVSMFSIGRQPEGSLYLNTDNTSEPAFTPRLQRGVNGFEFATHYLTHYKIV
jgi:hypothetical protein